MLQNHGRVHGLVVGVLLLVVAGCADRDPSRAPVDAEASSFCAAYARVVTADASTSSDDLEDYLNELAFFGTPRGIPGPARSGFEYLTDPDSDIRSSARLAAAFAQQDAVGLDLAALKAYAEGICARS